MTQSFYSTAKSFEDLLDRHFLTTSNLAVGFHSTVDTVRFRAIAKRINALTRNECTVIDVKLQQPAQWGQWSLRRVSNGDSELEVIYKPTSLSEYLTIACKANLDYAVYAKQTKFATLLRYEKEPTYASIRLKDSPFSVVGSWVHSLGNVGYALKTGLNLDPIHGWGKVAVWWKLAQSQVAAIGEYGPESTLRVLFSQRISPELEVGSRFETSMNKLESKIEVGGQYDLDSLTFIKGKFSSTGHFSLALAKELQKHVTIIAAGEIDMANPHARFSRTRLGLKLNINFIE